MRGFAVAAITVLVLVAAPAAQATQRFAAPEGAGTECTQAAPCSLKEAVEAAKGGDEVIVTPGTYTPTSGIFSPPVTNIQIHGEAGAPMPKIVASFGGTVLLLSQPGDSLSYLEIENDSNGGSGVICVGARVERVRVRVVGGGGLGVYVATDCAVRNSLFLVEGNGAIAVRSSSAGSTHSSASLRNVTAIASGSNSIGANSEYNEGLPGEFTLELQNSIVQGAEWDLVAVIGGKGPGNIAATHSNYDKSTSTGEAKVIDGGGNQTAAPLFVNAETRDFREAAGSPTIDAGSPGELGPLDLDGNARVQGSAPDIGAFEVNTPPISPAAGQLDSLAVKPRKFRAGNVAGAMARRQQRRPRGATISYSLSAPATVEFHVERAGTGRKVGGKCVKQTRANKSHRKCVIYKPLNGRFSVQGAAGANSFKFSGTVGGKVLKPGPYRLVGSAGNAIRRASVTIVK